MVALQALEMPILIFRTYLVSSVIAISIGSLLVIELGVSGAMIGWLVAYSVCACMMAFMLSAKLGYAN